MLRLDSQRKSWTNWRLQRSHEENLTNLDSNWSLAELGVPCSRPRHSSVARNDQHQGVHGASKSGAA